MATKTIKMPSVADSAPEKRVKRKSRQAELRALKLRQDVATLYLKGYSQTEIGAKLDVSQSAVSKVLTEVRERWRQNNESVLEERRMIELARIDWLEQQSQEAWDRSCEDGERETRKSEMMLKEVEVKQGNKGNKNKILGKMVPELKMVPVREYVERQRTKQSGNPAFLDRIAWCIEMRLKLFGIMDDRAVDVTVQQINWDGLHSRPMPQLDSVEAKLKQVEREAELAQVQDAVVIDPVEHFGMNGSVNGSMNGKH